MNARAVACIQQWPLAGIIPRHSSYGSHNALFQLAVTYVPLWRPAIPFKSGPGSQSRSFRSPMPGTQVRNPLSRAVLEVLLCFHPDPRSLGGISKLGLTVIVIISVISAQ